MHACFNEPTLSCLVKAESPGQGHLFYFRIDQAVPKGRGGDAKKRVLNQVEKHLSHLHGRTGLGYSLVYWSDPVRFTAYIRDNQIELS